MIKPAFIVSIQILLSYIQMGFIDLLMNISYVCKVLKKKMTLNSKNIIMKKKILGEKGKGGFLPLGGF